MATERPQVPDEVAEVVTGAAQANSVVALRDYVVILAQQIKALQDKVKVLEKAIYK